MARGDREGKSQRSKPSGRVGKKVDRMQNPGMVRKNSVPCSESRVQYRSRCEVLS